ncbi:MAG: hypothetical protein MJZ03_04550 [archaeon]|nr:hypothetical protein [archaeon]
MANVNCTVIRDKAGSKTNCYTYNPYIANWKSTEEVNELQPYTKWARPNYELQAGWDVPYSEDMYIDFVFINISSNPIPAWYICTENTDLEFVDFPLKDVYLDLGVYVKSPIHTTSYFSTMTWKSRKNNQNVEFLYDNTQIYFEPYIRFIKNGYVYLCKVNPFTNDRVYQTIMYSHIYDHETHIFASDSNAKFYNAETGDCYALYPPHTVELNTENDIQKIYYYNDVWYRFNPSETPTVENPYTCKISDEHFEGTSFYTGSYRWGNGLCYQYRPNLEYFLTSIACLGIYFKYEDVMYLGFMDSSGQTTGERLTEEEWEKSKQYDSDTVFNFTDHKEPYNPISPDDDDIDDMGFNSGSSYGGFIKYYQMGAVQMGQFGAELSNEDLIKSGFDPFKSIISLKKYHKPLWHFGNFSSQLEKIKVSYQEFNTEAQRLISSKGYLEIGNITVNGKYGTKAKPHFLDLEPYTSAELYIPYCGFLPLPVTKIMYNNITVTLVYDLRTGSCQAVVKCNGEYIGTKAGTLCEDIPITGEAVGLEKASIMNDVMGAITGGVQTASSLIAGVIGQKANPKSNSIGASIPSAANGVMTTISSITQAVVAANRNYTEVIGSASGETIFNMASKCYLKLSQPIAYVPELYNEMFGRPLNKSVILKEMKGLCVCEHVHINFPCTKTEEDLLVTALESGFYMPHRDLEV